MKAFLILLSVGLLFSPVPSLYSANEAVDSLTSLKFNGFIELNGAHSFSLYDSEEKQNFWVKPNEPFDGLRILEFNREELSLTVARSGTQRVIRMNSGTIAPLHTTSLAEMESTEPSGRGASPDWKHSLMETRMEVFVAREERQKRIRDRKRAIERKTFQAVFREN